MLRGPGDFLGVKQSGLPDFKVADLNQDLTVLEYARADAAEYVSRDDFATSEETKPLYEYLCAQNLTEVNFD
jgi:ATP-dependent DNA helicase RecG